MDPRKRYDQERNPVSLIVVEWNREIASSFERLQGPEYRRDRGDRPVFTPRGGSTRASSQQQCDVGSVVCVSECVLFPDVVLIFSLPLPSLSVLLEQRGIEMISRGKPCSSTERERILLSARDRDKGGYQNLHLCRFTDDLAFLSDNNIETSATARWCTIPRTSCPYLIHI